VFLGLPLALEMFDTLDPIFEIGKGLGVDHQLCRKIFEAFFAHAGHIKFCEVFEITGTFKAEGILVPAEYNCIGAAISHMFADNPGGNLPVFWACIFFAHNLSCILVVAGL